MPALPEALDAALRARYMPGEIRSPVQSRRGLTARLNALEKHYPTKRALAAALGVSDRTLRKWRSGETKVSPKNLRKIEGLHHRQVALPRMRRRLKALPPPNSVQVTAEVNWNGYKNRQAHRTVTLGGMRGVMAHVIRTWAAAGPEAAASVFERGTATVHNVPNSDEAPGIQFEGDDVTVSIPWES